MNNLILTSPIPGKLIPLKDVKDPAFASGAMGAGVGIEPSEGKVYAPFDAKVEVLFETKHAIGLTGINGEAVLIHVGVDTVNLNGAPYKNFVNQGDTIKKGDLLLTFDIEAIKKAGYDTTTPFLVTNAYDYDEITVKNDTQTLIAQAGKEISSETAEKISADNTADNAEDTASKKKYDGLS